VDHDDPHDRVIAHDRRGHGRSTQVGSGHDMDHYADDLAALTAHLDLKDAVHVGHSTGGGSRERGDAADFEFQGRDLPSAPPIID
jgi:pimeloyl-ACP methyl ester carboxylesterase